MSEVKMREFNAGGEADKILASCPQAVISRIVGILMTGSPGAEAEAETIISELEKAGFVIVPKADAEDYERIKNSDWRE